MGERERERDVAKRVGNRQKKIIFSRQSFRLIHSNEFGHLDLQFDIYLSKREREREREWQREWETDRRK